MYTSGLHCFPRWKMTARHIAYNTHGPPRHQRFALGLPWPVLLFTTLLSFVRSIPLNETNLTIFCSHENRGLDPGSYCLGNPEPRYISRQRKIPGSLPSLRCCRQCSENTGSFSFPFPLNTTHDDYHDPASPPTVSARRSQPGFQRQLLCYYYRE